MKQSLSGRLSLITFILAVACCAFAADTSSMDANWQKSLLDWRAQQATDLQAPNGWLTLVGLEWLQPGDNSFGAATDNKLVIKAQTAPHVGVVKLVGENLELQPPAGGYPKGLQVDGKVASGAQRLEPDTSGKPTKLTLGTVLITVIHRGDRYALRVKDAEAPTRTNFHGLKWYPPNPAYRVQAKWIPYDPPKKEKIPTILGTEVESMVPGAAEFTIDGKSWRLEPIVDSPDDKELFFIVRDLTSKTESYGAGRFLYVEPPATGLRQTATFWIDFNRLQNPPCAYTPYATCPLPPPQNRLQVALPVGEQRYHE